MVGEKNPGYAAGIGQRKGAKRIAWALKGAPLRTKDLRLSAVSGIAECRKLRNRVTEQMKDAELNPEDAIVVCVFAEPDLSALVPKLLPMNVENGVNDFHLVSEFVDKLPIGFLVWVWDRTDTEQPIFGHARPLIVSDSRSIELNEQALNVFERELCRRLAEDGVIPDDRN